MDCRVSAGSGGRLSIDEPKLALGLRMVYPRWLAQSYASGPVVADAEGVTHIDFLREAKGRRAAEKAKGELRVTQDGEKAAVAYALELPEAIELEQVGLQGQVGADLCRRCVLVVDGRARKTLAEGGVVFGGKATQVEFRTVEGATLVKFEFPKPNPITYMTSAVEKGGAGTFRIIFAERGSYAAGTRFDCSFKVAVPGRAVADDGRPVRRERNADWIPFMPETDILAGSACDYSVLRGTVKPCGAYGRVVVRNAHFEFERLPGVAQRFYGANVCMNACYPDRTQARRLVELIGRAGYNSVRLHHFDRLLTWNSPDATDLDPALMDRLDYFLAECYKAGLYVTADFFIGRLVPRKAVGLDGDGRIGQSEFKQLIYHNRALRDNFKKYIGNLLGHVNAYTGRRYGDEPGLFAIALINEGTPGPKADWAKECVGLADMEAALAADLKRFIREKAKSEVLISNISSGWSPAAYQLPRARVYDYVDDHHYYDHPQFPVKKWCAPWRYGNGNFIRSRQTAGFPPIALTRLLDRPYTVTEYNYCAPSAHRAAGALLVGAAAAAQDWGGVWRFEWTMNTNDATRLDFPEPFHATGFDAPGDPLQLIGEGLFAALFLRRDLVPLRETVAVTLDELALREPKTNEVINVKRTPWLWAGWRARLGTLVTGEAAPAGMREWRYPEAFSRPDAEVAAELPPVANIRANPDDGSLSVVSPRTCALYAEGGRIEAGALVAAVSDAPAAVWAIALDGANLADSRRVLLAHVTNVESTGMRRLERDDLLVFDHGKLPFLMRRGRADVSLSVAKAAWKAYALSLGGRRLREVPFAFDADGRLRLVCDTAADPERATFLYELVR